MAQSDGVNDREKQEIRRDLENKKVPSQTSNVLCSVLLIGGHHRTWEHVHVFPNFTSPVWLPVAALV